MMIAYVESWNSFIVMIIMMHELNVLGALLVLSHHVSCISIVDAANASCSEEIVQVCKTLCSSPWHVALSV